MGGGAAANDKNVPHTHHMFASQIAGAISTFTYYPLDVVKIRFMSQDGTKTRMHNNTVRYTSIFRSVGTIAREEGVRILYRGVHVAVLGATTTWGVYMYLYRSFSAIIAGWSEDLGFGKVASEGTFGVKSLASTTASAISSLASNPVWLIKTRMQVEEARPGVVHHYATFRGGLMHVIKTTGVLSLWRGIGAQLLLGIPNSFHFPIYDSMKQYRLTVTGKERLDLWEVCGCSVFSKAMLLSMSHPVFLLKTRLHDHRSRDGNVNYRNIFDATRTTFQREGFKGMYRGMVPSLCQTIPRAMTQLMLYETFLNNVHVLPAFPSLPAFS